MGRGTVVVEGGVIQALESFESSGLDHPDEGDRTTHHHAIEIVGEGGIGWRLIGWRGGLHERSLGMSVSRRGRR